MQVFVRKKKSGNIFPKKPEVGNDGLIAEIINSFRSPQTFVGDCFQRSDVIFVQADINPSGEQIVAGDCHGNIFVFDLTRNRFKLVKHLSLPVSHLAINLKKRTDFLASLSDYSLRCFNYDTQEQLCCLRGHETAITDISVHLSKRYAITTSSDTAFLWNLDTYERKRKLSINQQVDLLKAFFIPNTNSMMTCFKDNSILVWDAENLELLHELRSTMALDVTYRTFDCNSNGSRLAAAGKAAIIHIWDIGTQKIVKALQLPQETKAVRQICYLPQHLYTDEVIAAVCANGVLRVIDVKSSIELLTIGSYENKVLQLSISAEAGIAVCLMSSGNLNVYDMELLLTRLTTDQRTLHKDEVRSEASSAKHKTTKVRQRSICRVKDVMSQRIENSKTLNHIKLREILKEYGQFPEKYRTFIWKTLLKLPENYEAYSALLEKGIHPSFVDIQKMYPIRSLKLLRVFQRLLSAVAYWAPVVTECTFLPLLAFPFTKLLQNNQLVAFEVVASIMVNWCQKWFDFIPNPPLNILSMVENVLAYHDKELFQHFIKYRVSTQTYAWSLLETGFSEVFTRSEWMRLWDHILTNQPSWLLMAVVAYSLINRGPLLDCYEMEAFKQFYRHQNATGVAQVIKETYRVVSTTPNDLNPQCHLELFQPLSTGQYQLLAKFPQRIKNFQSNEIERIRKEQVGLLKSDILTAWTKG